MKILVTKNEMMNIATAVKKMSYNVEEVFESGVQATGFLASEDLLEMKEDMINLRESLEDAIVEAYTTDEEELELDLPDYVVFELLNKAEELDKVATSGIIEIIRFIGRNEKKLKMLYSHLKISVMHWCDLLIKPTDKETKDAITVEKKLKDLSNKIKTILVG